MDSSKCTQDPFLKSFFLYYETREEQELNELAAICPPTVTRILRALGLNYREIPKGASPTPGLRPRLRILGIEDNGLFSPSPDMPEIIQSWVGQLPNSHYVVALRQQDGFVDTPSEENEIRWTTAVEERRFAVEIPLAPKDGWVVAINQYCLSYNQLQSLVIANRWISQEVMDCLVFFQ